MRDMIERIALVCVLANAPLMGIAQTATTDQDGTAADPAQTEQTSPAATNTAAAPAEGVPEVMPEPIEGQIVLQSEDSILASDLMGLTVYSATDESVGDINDVIVKLDGTVEGVVVGVGGFLGMGEKDVAIEMDRIQLASPDEGGMRLVLSATRADLDAAPAFKTAAEQRLESEAEQMQQQMENGVAPAETN
ncbi:hypothetical protein DEA8626_00452 [Defluviimonas aquaemixtae]|uniref:PRC-barrel domain-containing protein n=1 Tax=Albidovulum aquaemixtae TaxID=1542388 RepID=A0A2R8B2W9_9RHOB|nr:PRC-barrel domain-containing protein [Defluviimonas aquaemixtae]SPH16938.1 hypothetical protein DEA8626_00452 [Defluviimonas aquaemixtae]